MKTMLHVYENKHNMHDGDTVRRQHKRTHSQVVFTVKHNDDVHTNTCLRDCNVHAYVVLYTHTSYRGV